LIRFREYILRKGEYGLELKFPESPWSKYYFPTLREALPTDGIPFRETRGSAADATAFIHLDCGSNIEKAVELAHRCFFDLFGHAPDPNARFQSKLENYSTLEEVDDPDHQAPKSWREYWFRYRATGLPDPKLIMKTAAYGVGLFFCCYPTLWWAWFQADGTSPDWQWTTGSLHLAGSHATWVLLLIFCGLLVGFRKTIRVLWKDIKRKPITAIERITSSLTTYALPLAVFTSWFGI
jgi:hypothetical protein